MTNLLLIARRTTKVIMWNSFWPTVKGKKKG